MREVVLDTETTGLKYRLGDRVIEVGCVELINHIQTGKTLQFYCNVNKKIDEGATRVHGITNEFLLSHPYFEDNVEVFLDFIRKDTLIIHNADFDLGFINNELKMVDKKALSNNVVDTVKLARQKLNTRIANLDYLCKRFSVDLGKRDLHGALLDSQLLAEVYLELIGGKQIKMTLDTASSKEDTMHKNNNNKYSFVKINVSDKDIDEHKKQVKQIKNPLWGKINY